VTGPVEYGGDRRTVVARLQDAAGWTAMTAGGQPTVSLSVVADAAEHLGLPVGAIEAIERAVGDRVDTTIDALDLRSFDDLERPRRPPPRWVA
jgi:hypothetical protein